GCGPKRPEAPMPAADRGSLRRVGAALIELLVRLIFQGTTPDRWRRRLRRRARSAVTVGVALALVLHVGLAVLLDVSPGLRDDEYGPKWPRLQARLPAKGPRRRLILGLGSSRTDRGFDAATVEELLRREVPGNCVVANFGTLGAGPFTQRLYLKRLLA